METDGFSQTSDTALPSAQVGPSLGGARAEEASAPVVQKEELHEELRKLRLRIMRLRALERTPHSDERQDEEQEQDDDSHPGSHLVTARRRSVRLTFAVALVAL